MRTILAFALLAAAGPAFAQEVEPLVEPTLSITATIKADSLTVRQRGKTEVHIWAEPGGEGEWKFDRNGIPGPIPVGKTVRDVTLNLDAKATVTDEGLELDADASGEAGN